MIKMTWDNLFFDKGHAFQLGVKHPPVVILM